MQNPAGRDVLTGKAIETGPVEPVPLTPAQQGMPPCAADLAAEAVQSQQVRRDCMVREVLELYRKRSGEMSPGHEHIFSAGAFLIQRLEGSGLEPRRYAF